MQSPGVQRQQTMPTAPQIGEPELYSTPPKMQPQHTGGTAGMSYQPPPGGAYQPFSPYQIDSKPMMRPQHTGGGTPTTQPQYASSGTPTMQPQYTGGGSPIQPPLPSAHPPEYSQQPYVYDPNMPKQSSTGWAGGERGSPAPAPAPAVQAFGAPRMYQTALPLMALNESAAPVDCPVCGQREVTRVEYNVGSTTHVWAVVLFFLIGLPCIPYLMNSTKDVKHSCGRCSVHLATWRRGGNTQVFQHA